jgi:CRISPR-associated protein Csm2
MSYPTRPATTNNRPASHGYGQSRQEDAATLNTSKIVFGNTIDANLYADIAEAVAKHIAADNRNAVKPTQARRFYDEIVMWEEKIRQNPASFNENLPLIRMMKAKAAYAVGRKTIDKNFEAMINAGLTQVVDAKTLAQFKLFFEAFMGFYKVHGPK